MKPISVSDWSQPFKIGLMVLTLIAGFVFVHRLFQYLDLIQKELIVLNLEIRK